MPLKKASPVVIVSPGEPIAHALALIFAHILAEVRPFNTVTILLTSDDLSITSPASPQNGTVAVFLSKLRTTTSFSEYLAEELRDVPQTGNRWTAVVREMKRLLENDENKPQLREGQVQDVDSEFHNRRLSVVRTGTKYAQLVLEGAKNRVEYGEHGEHYVPFTTLIFLNCELADSMSEQVAEVRRGGGSALICHFRCLGSKSRRQGGPMEVTTYSKSLEMIGHVYDAVHSHAKEITSERSAHEVLERTCAELNDRRIAREFQTPTPPPQLTESKNKSKKGNGQVAVGLGLRVFVGCTITFSVLGFILYRYRKRKAS